MPKRMPKAKQELKEVERVAEEKSSPPSLSEFVSTGVRDRLQTFEEQRNLDNLQKTQVIGIRNYTCTNGFIHDVKVVKYDDTSIWVMCPMFGWYNAPGGAAKLGCRERKKQCTWFIG